MCHVNQIHSDTQPACVLMGKEQRCLNSIPPGDFSKKAVAVTTGVALADEANRTISGATMCLTNTTTSSPGTGSPSSISPSTTPARGLEASGGAPAAADEGLGERGEVVPGCSDCSATGPRLGPRRGGEDSSFTGPEQLPAEPSSASGSSASEAIRRAPRAVRGVRINYSTAVIS